MAGSANRVGTALTLVVSADARELGTTIESHASVNSASCSFDAGIRREVITRLNVVARRNDVRLTQMNFGYGDLVIENFQRLVTDCKLKRAN